MNGLEDRPRLDDGRVARLVPVNGDNAVERVASASRARRRSRETDSRARRRARAATLWALVAQVFAGPAASQAITEKVACPPLEQVPAGLVCIDRTAALADAGDTVRPPIDAPSNGAHAHFDAWKDRDGIVAAWSLRDEKQLQRPPIGVGGADPSMFEYDPEHDGMKLTMSRERWEASAHPAPASTGMSLDGRRMLVAQFPRMSYADGTRRASFQMEVRVDDGYNLELRDTIGWNGNLKFLTLRDARKSKLLEQRAVVGDDATVAPEFRYYWNATFVDEAFVDDVTPLRLRRPEDGGDIDFQPSSRTRSLRRDRPHDLVDLRDMLAGDVTKPALIPPNQWVRVTYHVEFLDPVTWQVRAYIAGEAFDPVLWFGSRQHPDRGMQLRTASPERTSIAYWYVPEHNSSTGGVFGDSGLAAHSWYRNVLVSDSEWIDLGGRPQ